MHSHLSDAWKKPKEMAQWKPRLLQFRREPALVRIEHPTRLNRARALGYKAKQGIAVIRVRVDKGNRLRPRPPGGRKPRQRGRLYPLHKSRQAMAEEKAARHYPNMEVLNSYWVAEDGSHKWFECILLDRAHPAILSDSRLAPVARQRGRAFRGLTAAHNPSRR